MRKRHNRFKIEGDFEAPRKKIIQRAMAQVIQHITDAQDEDWSRGETPIEKALFAAVWAEIQFGRHEFTDVFAPTPGERLAFQPDCGPADLVLIFESQIKILDWPVDFVVGFWARNGEKEAPIVIECDGHDFHERTKAQAAKDRSRDRRLQELGYTVFRFTGSEIWNDPCGCANQIIDLAVTKACWP